MTSTQFHRRNFLSLAGKSLGLAALSSSTIASLLREIHAATKNVAHLTPEQAAMDEDYWATIQNAFSVTRGIINLNNGGVCPSPRIVTEALVRYIWQQEDATPTRCGRFSSRNAKRFAPDWRSCLAVTVKRLRSRATPRN